MKRLALLFTLFIIATIIAADMGIIDRYLGWLDRFGGDKAGHFILFGLLNLFLILAFLTRRDREPLRVTLTVSLVLAILIGLEEWSQSIFPERTTSLSDLIASYAGVIAFGWIAYRIKK